MERKYLISFGDSTRYRVAFDGNRDEFENSDKLRGIRREVEDFLKKEFPTGGYDDIVELTVADDDGRDYTDLDKDGLADLLQSVKTQVEVQRDTDEINLNAPFDKH